MINNYARCTQEIKSRIAVAKEAFYKKAVSIRKMELNLREKRVK
jgi:hypothetical protein